MSNSGPSGDQAEPEPEPLPFYDWEARGVTLELTHPIVRKQNWDRILAKAKADQAAEARRVTFGKTELYDWQTEEPQLELVISPSPDLLAKPTLSFGRHLWETAKSATAPVLLTTGSAVAEVVVGPRGDRYIPAGVAALGLMTVFCALDRYSRLSNPSEQPNDEWIHPYATEEPDSSIELAA